MTPHATCPECRRVFDLADEDDAEEWAYGHDCEEDAPSLPAEAHATGQVAIQGLDPATIPPAEVWSPQHLLFGHAAPRIPIWLVGSEGRDLSRGNIPR
jgi:hypothetical protein